MYKFCIDKKRLDLTKYKRLQIFNDIFQFVWSGEYNEDIPYSLSDNDKLGYPLEYLWILILMRIVMILRNT